jgi:hypothetical protein
VPPGLNRHRDPRGEAQPGLGRSVTDGSAADGCSS